MNVWSVWENSFHNKSWSSLGSSFENKDSETICWIGENVDFFNGNDNRFDHAVMEAEEKLNLGTRIPFQQFKGDLNVESELEGENCDEEKNTENDNHQQDLKNLKSSNKENAKAAARERLSFLYQDPNYGPKYFQENAHLLKHLLFIYKFTKDANNYEMFYLKRSSSGICIYFNTYTRKRLVVVPVGIPGLEPSKISVQEFRAWYKEQREKAKELMMKIRRELFLLVITVEKAEDEKTAAFQSFETIAKKRKRLQRIISSKYSDILNKTEKYNKTILESTKYIVELQEELLGSMKIQEKLLQNQGMYEEKDFLKKTIKVLRTITDIWMMLYNIESNLYIFLARVIKEVNKFNGRAHNLRSRTCKKAKRKS